jgi:hypothetical protein
VNRDLEAKARALAGLKGYVTNLTACPDGTPVTAELAIDAYHRLSQIQTSLRMSKHDLQARPIYHHKRESIEAHLTIVLAALAVSRWIEDATASRSRNSSAPSAATTPSRSKQARTPSPPNNSYPTTSAPHSTPSTASPLDTNLSQVG